MCRSPRARDDHLHAAALRPGAVVEHHVRGAMGGHDLRLIGNVELAEDLRRVLHGVPIGLAAHDDADEGSRHGVSSVKAIDSIRIISLARGKFLDYITNNVSDW